MLLCNWTSDYFWLNLHRRLSNEMSKIILLLIFLMHLKKVITEQRKNSSEKNVSVSFCSVISFIMKTHFVNTFFPLKTWLWFWNNQEGNFLNENEAIYVVDIISDYFYFSILTSSRYEFVWNLLSIFLVFQKKTHFNFQPYNCRGREQFLMLN